MPQTGIISIAARHSAPGVRTVPRPPSALAPFVVESGAAGHYLWRLLTLMLDEIDYGMLLVGPRQNVLHANQAALAELCDDHVLALEDGHLSVAVLEDRLPLREALHAALYRGLRTLLAVGKDGRRVSVAVVPLPKPRGGEPPAALLVLGKRRICEELSVEGFARCHGLTPAETKVLKGLCSGALPSQIAGRQGVRLSTVRTQIGSIREKTGAGSIGALMRQTAVLPPIVNALRA